MSVSPLSSGTAASIKWESICCTSFTGLWWWIWQNDDLGWEIVLPYNWCGCGCWVLSIAMCEVIHCYETIKGLCIPLVPPRCVSEKSWKWEGARGGDFSALTSPHIPSHSSQYRGTVLRICIGALGCGGTLNQPAVRPFALISCGYSLVGVNSCCRGPRWA